MGCLSGRMFDCSTSRACCATSPYLLPALCSGRQVALDVAEAMAFMHGTLHVMHGDMKSR